jgi:U6 snRNA-associated Sm-like protein LSm1
VAFDLLLTYLNLKDPEKENSIPLREVSLDDIYAAQQDEIDNRRRRELTKNSKLIDIGFSIDTQQEDMY